MKILLFGKDGQVGFELQKRLGSLGELFALGKNSKMYCGDFTNAKGISQSIRNINPDVIVNAAAYTDVDKAEENLSLSFSINADILAVIAEEAKLANALLIHYSTDYVFDGNGEMPWFETDKTSPINVYGLSKAKGEEFIQNSGCKHLILRTSWVYGIHGDNFIKNILLLAAKCPELKVVSDQIGSPTSAMLLARLTTFIIPKTLQETELNGTYHVCPSGETSWLDYAKFILDVRDKLGLEANIRNIEIQGALTNQFKFQAKRPLNSKLNTNKFSAAFNIQLPHWKVEVENTVKSFLNF
jgi:dTDP-4-dehydrorhamnose reductase